MICNASPLIFLSKINQLSLLKNLFGSIIISEEIKEEVLEGNRLGASSIQNAINQGWIKIIKGKTNIDIGIKGGESSVINLAIERKDMLIIDDSSAIKAAKAFNVDIIRTTTVIFIGVEKNIITKKQAISLIKNLIEAGYYISPKYYAAIFDKLR